MGNSAYVENDEKSDKHNCKDAFQIYCSREETLYKLMDTGKSRGLIPMWYFCIRNNYIAFLW